MGKRILVVDDEKLIVKGIRFSLEQDGYSVDCAYDGEEALKLAKENAYDMILLDVMLPKHDGFEVCQQIREYSDVPIIMLTAKGEDMDKILGLEYGADDYVTKPFSPSELVARVDALYRRVTAVRSRNEVNYLEKIESGAFVLNLRSRTLKKDGQPVELTQVEFQIMEYFFTNPGKALSRTEILTRVWGEEYFGEEKIVDVNIRRLRMKIEDDPSAPKYILTVWGMGYKWSADGAKA